ncbi:MAG: PQQ-binding-like beta-propeller repeat protein [Phycisphaeraceae bacterium]
MKRYAIWPVAAMLSLVLLGCQSDKGAAAPVEGDPEFVKLIGKPTGLLIEPVDALKLGYKIDWATSINLKGKESVTSLAVLGDLLVTVERPDNVITAIKFSDGTMAWRTSVGGSYDRLFTPSRVDNMIIVNTETQLYKLDANKNGELLGRENLKSAVNAPSALVGEYAVFGGSDGMVFGHDTRVGYAKWSYKMPAQILVPAQSAGSQVFIAGADGQYAMFQGRTGEILWRGRVFARVSAPPAVTSVGVFIASEDNSMYCLHRSTGEDRWIFRYTAPLRSSPIQLQNAVYLPLPSGEIVSLKVTDGAENWRIKTEDKLVAQDSHGLLFNAGNKLILRDPRSGKQLEEIDVKGSIQHLIAAEGGSLIVISPKGSILKLSPVK